MLCTVTPLRSRSFAFAAFTTNARVRISAYLIALSGACIDVGSLSAQNASAGSKLDWFGDARLRFERDWDSQTAAGVQRDDRTRGRVRARIGFSYQADENWSLGARVRTGSSESQQSPHLTFASSPGGSDDFDGGFDRYFLQYKNSDVSTWVGRNSFPFWQQNEFFWDDDVTPTGVAASFSRNAGTGKLTTVLGGFALPDGLDRLNGRLFSGQVRYTTAITDGELTMAAGLHRFDGEEGARNISNRNGARDYLIGVFGAQWTINLDPKPLALGVDLFHNFENYDAAESSPYAVSRSDETTGYVLSALYGQLKDKGDWQLGYWFARIETFAVNASFAQDDWVRFGSATQTDGTDVSGHELRFSYAISKQLNAMARLWVADAISSRQDGNRFRVDLNWRF